RSGLDRRAVGRTAGALRRAAKRLGAEPCLFRERAGFPAALADDGRGRRGLAVLAVRGGVGRGSRPAAIRVRGNTDGPADTPDRLRPLRRASAGGVVAGSLDAAGVVRVLAGGAVGLAVRSGRAAWVRADLRRASDAALRRLYGWGSRFSVRDTAASGARVGTWGDCGAALDAVLYDGPVSRQPVAVAPERPGAAY